MIPFIRHSGQDKTTGAKSDQQCLGTEIEGRREAAEGQGDTGWGERRLISWLQ